MLNKTPTVTINCDVPGCPEIINVRYASDITDYEMLQNSIFYDWSFFVSQDTKGGILICTFCPKCTKNIELWPNKKDAK